MLDFLFNLETSIFKLHISTTLAIDWFIFKSLPLTCFSYFWTNDITFPVTPQEKQVAIFFLGWTTKLGLLSLWNGHNDLLWFNLSP